MFRRIELIHSWPYKILDDGTKIDEFEYLKSGLMGITSEEVADAWLDKLRGPKSGVPINARFYFTEKGWKEIGRNVIAALIKTKTEYRVIAIKETDAQVVWRDKVDNYEVAVQPKRNKK